MKRNDKPEYRDKKRDKEGQRAKIREARKNKQKRRRLESPIWK